MGLLDHWFLRGAQSAAFYYISCTPCVETARMKKRRRDARHERQEMERIIQDGGDPYAGYHRQPDPFSTNQYWLLEDSPPKTPLRSKKSQRRRTNSRDGASRTGTRDGSLVRVRSPAAASDGARRSHDESLPVLPVPWNRETNQREDDMPWGFEYTTRPRRIVPLSESSATRIPPPIPEGQPISTQDYARPKLQYQSTDGSTSSFPSLSRSGSSSVPIDSRAALPDLNELIPPNVVLPEDNILGNMWFRQPPPSTDFMDNRTDLGSLRTTSNTSLNITAMTISDTARREPELRKELSRHFLTQQRSRTTLEIPGSRAVSRSNTQRTNASRKQSATDVRELAIPNILDDDYTPPHAVQQPAHQLEEHATEGTSTSVGTSVTVVHNPPSPPTPVLASDAASEADIDSEDDADSGIDIDSPSPQSLSTEPTIVRMNTTESKSSTRQKPLRTITAPENVKTTAIPKSYVLPVTPKRKTGTRNTKKNVRTKSKTKTDPDDLWRIALEAAGHDDVEQMHIPEMVFDEDEWSEEANEDPRWTWVRSRRWSADV